MGWKDRVVKQWCKCPFCKELITVLHDPKSNVIELKEGESGRTLREREGGDLVPNGAIKNSPAGSEGSDKRPNQSPAAANSKPQYIYAYDPTIHKRVVHVVKGGFAISMVTGHNFKYNGETGRG